MWKKTAITLWWLLMLLLPACMPSLQYRIGQGFYSDTYAKTQVQAAANAGKVKNLGHFSTDAGGCGNFSQDMTDQNVVIPAIKEKLQEIGANVADNVTVNERTVFDFFLGLLIIPGLIGCGNFTISGEALLVQSTAMNLFPNMTNISAVGEPPMGVIFEKR